MTIYSGIFNSINGDRKYNAWWFAKYFATFIGNGVFPNPSTGLQVMADERMQVKVRPGSGWIDGYFLYSDDDYILELDKSDGLLKRIDRVVMRLDHAERLIKIVIKKGAFASAPVAPTLQRDGNAYELALADIFITNGATQITQADVTDTRLNKTLCGIVHGTVNQVDTTTIFNQYQAWFDSVKDGTEQEIADWQQQQYADFQIWFDSIKDILDGDVAANLVARITTLEQQFTIHQADLSHVHWIGAVTGTNSLIATYASISDLKEGLAVSFKSTIESTGATTLNINNLGAIPILKVSGNPVTNLKANGIYTLRYANGNFILQGEGGSGNAIASDLLSGKTATTDAGDIVGTMPNRGAFNLALGSSVPAGYYSGGNVPGGKRWASGQSTLDNGWLRVRGLSFSPSFVYLNNGANTYSFASKEKPNILTMYGATAGSNGISNFYSDGFEFDIKFYYGNYSMVNWVIYE